MVVLVQILAQKAQSQTRIVSYFAGLYSVCFHRIADWSQRLGFDGLQTATMLCSCFL